MLTSRSSPQNKLACLENLPGDIFRYILELLDKKGFDKLRRLNSCLEQRSREEFLRRCFATLVKSIVSTEKAIWILTRDGTVLTCSGLAINIKKSRLPSLFAAASPTASLINITKVNGLQEKIVQIAANKSKVWFLTENGDVYSKTQNADKACLYLVPEKVRTIRASVNFTIFITVTNNLYGIGCSNYNDILNQNLFNDPTLHTIEIPENETIVDVACGTGHYALLTASSKLFLYGNNVWNQLGTYGAHISCNQLRNACITQVVAGDFFTAFINSLGMAYVCGNFITDDQSSLFRSSGYSQPSLIKTQIKKLFAVGGILYMEAESGELYNFMYQPAHRFVTDKLIQSIDNQSVIDVFNGLQRSLILYDNQQLYCADYANGLLRNVGQFKSLESLRAIRIPHYEEWSTMWRKLENKHLTNKFLIVHELLSSYTKMLWGEKDYKVFIANALAAYTKNQFAITPDIKVLLQYVAAELASQKVIMKDMRKTQLYALLNVIQDHDAGVVLVEETQQFSAMMRRR